MSKKKGADSPPVTLVPVTGERSLASFVAAEEAFPDGWPAAALESYEGHLVLGATSPSMDWAGCAAYRVLADVGWVLVDLVRGDDPFFYELLGRRLLGVRKARRIGLFMPEGHAGIATLSALGFSVVGDTDPCDRLAVTPSLTPEPGFVRLVWNADFVRGKQ